MECAWEEIEFEPLDHGDCRDYRGLVFAKRVKEVRGSAHAAPSDEEDRNWTEDWNTLPREAD
jgi:hypothetical protein